MILLQHFLTWWSYHSIFWLDDLITAFSDCVILLQHFLTWWSYNSIFWLNDLITAFFDWIMLSQHFFDWIMLSQHFLTGGPMMFKTAEDVNKMHHRLVADGTSKEFLFGLSDSVTEGVTLWNDGTCEQRWGCCHG